MSSISAIFKPSADGSIHLPIPPELRGNARLRVVAWLEPAIQGAKSPSPGQWAKKARGIARRLPGVFPAREAVGFFNHNSRHLHAGDSSLASPIHSGLF
jgi:hypothetical protein